MLNFFKKPKKYSIYIIDDDPDVSEIIEESIAPNYKDADIVVHNDSLKALEELKGLTKLPEVILCDMNMPGIRGLQLRESLISSNINIPFIFISGLSGESVFEENYTILSKPIDFKVLFEHIQKHLI